MSKSKYYRDLKLRPIRIVCVTQVKILDLKIKILLKLKKERAKFLTNIPFLDAEFVDVLAKAEIGGGGVGSFLTTESFLIELVAAFLDAVGSLFAEVSSFFFLF
jgi:hypothetical protein